MAAKKCEVVLTIDVQHALDTFPFIQNENVTLLEREEKGNLYSLCDAAPTSGRRFHCDWDRHPIEGPIYKCPIRKVYKGEQKTYKSDINGNSYTIQDNLNTADFYYETDGQFCSPECRWAFLDAEESHNPLYADSKQLLLAALGIEPRPAPHWKTLAVYGGALSINDFRASFAHKQYTLEEVSSSVHPFLYRFKESYHL
jgi:hypothetical protein